jgi:hypothetical protein
LRDLRFSFLRQRRPLNRFSVALQIGHLRLTGTPIAGGRRFLANAAIQRIAAIVRKVPDTVVDRAGMATSRTTASRTRLGDRL